MFFLWICYLQAPDNLLCAVSNLFKNSQRYSQLKIDPRWRWHRRLILQGLNSRLTNNTDRLFTASVDAGVKLTTRGGMMPGLNLSIASVNFYQIESKLNMKNLSKLNVSITSVIDLDLWISFRIFAKLFWNFPVGLIRSLLMKEPEVKNLVILSLQKDSLKRWIFLKNYFYKITDTSNKTLKRFIDSRLWASKKHSERSFKKNICSNRWSFNAFYAYFTCDQRSEDDKGSHSFPVYVFSGQNLQKIAGVRVKDNQREVEEMSYLFLLSEDGCFM